jgi:serine protease Do
MGCQTPSSVIKARTGVGAKLTKDSLVSKYLRGRDLDLVEGVWVWADNSYEVLITRNSSASYPQYEYLGIITDSRRSGWTLGDIKMALKKTVSDYVYSGIYFMQNATEEGTAFTLPNENMIEMSLPTGPYGMSEKTQLIRTYPPKDSRIGAMSKGSAITKTGTGFFISSDIVATNYHVVADSKEIAVTWNERRLPASIVMKDQVNDLALLRVAFPSGGIERNLAAVQVVPLSMGDVRTVKDGDKVFTIGYPLTSELGKRARVSEGIVNSTVGVEDDPRMLQISVPIQPGNSGGPLFNNLGQVIGVVTSTINNAYLILQKGTFPQNVNFAMKINYLNNLVSLLPGDTNLARNLRPREINASQLMETTRNSILFIESSN